MKYFKFVYLLVVLTAIPGESIAQWEAMPSSPPGYFRDVAIADGDIYLGHFSQGVYKSVDSTATWQQLNDGLDTTQARSIYQFLLLEDDIYAATVNGIYKSTNGGENWVKKSDGITIGPGAIYEFTESIFEYSGTLFTGAWNGIYSSSDFGESWEITNVMGQGVGPGFFINHDGTLFAARENINFPYGYISADEGSTWDPLTTISIPTITFLSEPNRLWSGTIHGIWLSTDNGASWDHRSNGLPPDPYNSSIIRVNGKLVSSVKFGGSGVFYSDNEGMNWTDFSDGLPFLSSIEKLIVYGDKIFAATSDGIWQRDTSDVSTAVKSDGYTLPRKIHLSQNYPNPFNAHTTISYALSEASYVTLEIYDALGRKTATPVAEYQDAGYHSIIWQADNISSGMYFYKITAGGHSRTNKLILLK